jgi:glycerol dehydrogenase-like iron-containing ADH family enzyme
MKLVTEMLRRIDWLRPGTSDKLIDTGTVFSPATKSRPALGSTHSLTQMIEGLFPQR